MTPDPTDTHDERAGSLWGLFFAGVICVAFYLALLAGCVWLGGALGCASASQNQSEQDLLLPRTHGEGEYHRDAEGRLWRWDRNETVLVEDAR